MFLNAFRSGNEVNLHTNIKLFNATYGFKKILFHTPTQTQTKLKTIENLVVQIN